MHVSCDRVISGFVAFANNITENSWACSHTGSITMTTKNCEDWVCLHTPEEEPLITIPSGLRMDSYKMSKQIKEAIAQLDFDIVIDTIRVIPRRKVPTEEPEDEEE